MDSYSNPSTDFTALDDAFFAEGDRLAEQEFESFDDLDDDYQQPSFWDRLRRKRTR